MKKRHIMRTELRSREGKALGAFLLMLGGGLVLDGGPRLVGALLFALGLGLVLWSRPRTSPAPRPRDEPRQNEGGVPSR